ncbi:MAG: hypothetical protein GTO02_16125 [Candidatus Dadabacteria bacterium]|nr:hypothetical protein [Candidatus Dadabacteria bacterium]NIQ15858.1 hypothetical protein [Candidatus Dadabacteria bacterium]
MYTKSYLQNIFFILIVSVGIFIFILSLSCDQDDRFLLSQNIIEQGFTSFDGFQFDAPFRNDNPFDAETLMMIDSGFDTFMNQEFEGNGRTCGTCHIPEAQYNVLPGDIQEMTPEEKDLVLGGINTDLEDAELVEKFALFNITELHSAGSEGNTSNPAGPFRASMPLLSNGLGLTTANMHVCRNDNFTFCKTGPPPVEPPDFPGNPPFPGCTQTDFSTFPVCVHTVPELSPKRFTILPNTDVAVHDGTRDIMLGWSGNGAIDEMFEFEESILADDTDCLAAIEEFADEHTDLEAQLALFALTAVKTHFPITQGRTPGVDFRCPTVEELTDMAKHQKWLGRRYELDITEMNFTTTFGNEGRDLFLDRNSGCSGCHINAGANDNQGRLKLGPFDVIPPLTNSQEALKSAEYECPEIVHCETDADCTSTGREDVEGYTCDTELIEPICKDDLGNPLLVDDLLDALDELMPRSGMGANKTSRSGTQFLESLVDNEVSVNFPFDEGDGQLRSGRTQGGFNVQPAFQAAAKTDFFHNNAVTGKLENAIAHYFTANFDDSQGGNAIRGSFRCDKTGSVALAALGGTEAIDKIGYFLRSLFAVYSISDCERFMDEARDRLKNDPILPIDLPLTHCQFALKDLQTALLGSNLTTDADEAIVLESISIIEELDSILGTDESELEDPLTRAILISELTNLRKNLVGMRHDIATTPEL